MPRPLDSTLDFFLDGKAFNKSYNVNSIANLRKSNHRVSCYFIYLYFILMAK